MRNGVLIRGASASSHRNTCKEAYQQNIVEILKIASSRSEDLIQLRSLTDRSSNKMKVSYQTAEKVINEVVLREEHRCPKETTLISLFSSQTLEKLVMKK